ncbi:MAG: hypothetical protein MZV64_18005 [Ignavibacteriales bacterium]|nr:hypothetical protein [Ignavibacteriales bacterium]
MLVDLRRQGSRVDGLRLKDQVPANSAASRHRRRKEARRVRWSWSFSRPRGCRRIRKTNQPRHGFATRSPEPLPD